MGTRGALSSMPFPPMAPEARVIMFARISASRSPQDAIATFAGGALPHHP